MPDFVETIPICSLTGRRAELEKLRDRLNRREFVHPDPLEFLYRYDDPADREIVALTAACLAYGRVAQILRSVDAVLAVLGPNPAKTLRDMRPAVLRRKLAGFKHRFSTGGQVAAMLGGARTIIKRHGSLGVFFAAGVSAGDETVLPAIGAFVDGMEGASCESSDGESCGHLLPHPDRGSACKRLHLMLRWLVRRDEVDPGGWEAVGAEKLLVPLDVHMHRIARAMGATRRRAGDQATVLEVTAAFRQIAPRDPVRYDFALTRLGIRSDVAPPAFLECMER